MTKSYDTEFIRDIDASPRFIDEVIMTMKESIKDMVEDFCFQTMTDYLPAPECEHEEDAMIDQVLSPLQDRVMNQIHLEYIRRLIES